MAPDLSNIVIKSVRYYKKPALYQVLIVALLSAVITGSLLTGWSVRASLKKIAAEHLGNTGVLISSGTRFFDISLAERLRDSALINCTGLLEINGYCQNLSTQKRGHNTHIYAVTDDFFRFNGIDTIKLIPGEVAVNEKIAISLNLKRGDELIIRFYENSDIPADAPFAPSISSTVTHPARRSASAGPKRSWRKCCNSIMIAESGFFFSRMTISLCGAPAANAGRTSSHTASTPAVSPSAVFGRSAAAPNMSTSICFPSCVTPVYFSSISDWNPVIKRGSQHSTRK